MTSKERYYWYKSLGICVRCGQAPSAKGRVCCLNCLDKNAISAIRYKSKHPMQNMLDCRKRYYIARELGICVRCYKNNAREGKAICEKCFVKIREKQRMYQKRKRMEIDTNGR